MYYVFEIDYFAITLKDLTLYKRVDMHFFKTTVVSMLMIFFISAICSSCSKCQGDLPQNAMKSTTKHENSDLLLVADNSILRYLAPILEDLRKSSPQNKIMLKAANLEQLTSKGKEADLLIVPGHDKLTELRKSLDLQDESIKYVYRTLQLVVRKDCKIKLDRPAHLLQPALSKIAITGKNTALGHLSWSFLKQWKLDSRISHKLLETKDQPTALKYLKKKAVEAAFVFENKEVDYNLNKSILDNSMTSKKHLQFFFAVNKNSKNLPQIKELVKYLQKKEVLTYLEKFGFHKPEQLIHIKQDISENQNLEADSSNKVEKVKSNKTFAVENK